MNPPELLATFCSAIMLIPTLASLTRFDQWWVRGFDFPRLQICFLIILVLSFDLFVFSFEENWQLILVGLLFATFLYQIKKIIPYTRLGHKQVLRFQGHDPQSLVSVLVSNVLTPNKRSDKLLAVIHEEQPDIILTLETDKRWENELSVLEKDYPYTVKIPQDNLYGMHLYSRLELKDIEVKYLISDEIPSIHGYVLLGSGHKIRISCLHPKPPSPTEDDTSTDRDAELLLVGKELDVDNESVLVFGDLNDVAWSRTTRLFQKISGLLDPRRGRGFYNTYNSKHFFLRWPLDHVFHSRDFTLVALKRLRSIESDHFPIFIKLNYEPRATILQDDTDPLEEEEAEWADEKIDKGKKKNGRS